MAISRKDENRYRMKKLNRISEGKTGINHRGHREHRGGDEEELNGISGGKRRASRKGREGWKGFSKIFPMTREPLRILPILCVKHFPLLPVHPVNPEILFSSSPQAEARRDEPPGFVLFEFVGGKAPDFGLEVVDHEADALGLRFR